MKPDSSGLCASAICAHPDGQVELGGTGQVVGQVQEGGRVLPAGGDLGLRHLQKQLGRFVLLAVAVERLDPPPGEPGRQVLRLIGHGVGQLQDLQPAVVSSQRLGRGHDAIPEGRLGDAAHALGGSNQLRQLGQRFALDAAPARERVLRPRRGWRQSNPSGDEDLAVSIRDPQGAAGVGRLELRGYADGVGSEIAHQMPRLVRIHHSQQVEELALAHEERVDRIAEKLLALERVEAEGDPDQLQRLVGVEVHRREAGEPVVGGGLPGTQLGQQLQDGLRSHLEAQQEERFRGLDPDAVDLRQLTACPLEPRGGVDAFTPQERQAPSEDLGERIP